MANLPAHTHAGDGSALHVATTVNLASVTTNPVTVPSTSSAFISASGDGPGSASIYSKAQGPAPVALQGVSSTVSGSVTTTQTASGFDEPVFGH